MINYNINKGIGRTAEFKGLKTQYLFLFTGGLLATLVLVMVLYMAGANSYLCLAVAGVGSGCIVWGTFTLNRKYGEHGLMKLAAKRKHPQYITCRKPIAHLLQSLNTSVR